MIFKKISILVLLVLCTTYPGETRSRCKRRNCGYNEKTKSDTDKGEPSFVMQHDNELGKIYGQRESDPKYQIILNKKSNPSGVSKGGDHQSITPLKYFPPYTVTSDGNINWNPLSAPANNIGEQGTSNLNADPSLTETLLKQMWLSHQLDNVNPQGQDLIFDTEPRQVQVLPREDYFEIPHNNVINNFDKQQNSEPSEFRFLNSLLDKQFHSNYDNGNSDLNNDQDNDVNSTDSDSNENSESSNFNHSNYNDNDDNYKAGIMTLGAPHLIPLAEYGVDKQQANIPRPEVITASKFGAEKRQGSVPNYTQVITPTNIGNKNYDDFKNLRGHFPGHTRTYKIFNYNVPHKYDLIGSPENKFRSKKYYDQQNQTKNQKPVAYENFNNNIPNDEKRYHIPATHIASNRIPSTQQERGKFSKWVLDQMEIFKSKNQGPDNIDLNALGYSILQILSENGMHITDNGMLIDTYGNVSNIDTLCLTPIIIGNAMSLLEGKHGVMSSKLQTPYLQAILVSAAHPGKILGIMPLGITYLPLSTLSSVTNVWDNIPKGLKFAKSREDEVVDENEPKKDEPEKLNVNKTKNATSDDVDGDYYSPGQSSNHINVKENNDNIERSRLLKTFPSKRGFRSEDNLDDGHPYSEKFISQEELESNGVRLFTPHIEFREQPIDILTRRDNLPNTVVASKIREPARIHIPSISSLLDFALRSENTPADNGKSTQNNIASEISNEPAAISDILGKLSDTTKALLGILKKETKLPSRRYQIVDDKAKPIFKWKEQGLQTIPLDYTDVNVFEELDIGSRSGVQPELPEVPPEDVHNGNNAFDFMENEDDDEGDFRIIGGNAATGSGTPLSNKGR